MELIPPAVKNLGPSGAAPCPRGAFWSGQIGLGQWRAMLAHPERHGQMVKAFFVGLPSDEALTIMGEANFLKQWPRLRHLFQECELHDRQRQRLFDAAWSLRTVGDSQYPVDLKVASLSKGRLALLREAIAAPGLSIYQLAKKVERDYARVHKEVHILKELGFFDTSEGAGGGRKTVRVFAPHSINTQLYLRERERG